MREELVSLLNFVLDLLREFGLNDFYLELSTRPEGKAVGSDQEWQEAEETLESVARTAGLELVLDAGGGAFYGPKISVQARDAIGRTHQMSTIQLDFQLPQRFDATYIAADGTRTRPIMIHRALFGSIERFMAILIEHYAGALPTWLAPEQVHVLSVSGIYDDYAHEVALACRAAGLRAHAEPATEPLGARIRRSKLEKVPYILVVGEVDVQNRTVGVNARGSIDPERGVAMKDFIDRVAAESLAHASPEVG
jgi:threonyl-tRNA synthetase